jgi:DNA-binding transcriptional LysR family regulator
MVPFTLQEIHCFDAVVREAGFLPAAQALNRSHAAVFAAVAKLEERLGVVLFDRSGYRVVLTVAGLAFHDRSRALLGEAESLGLLARQLATGEETRLRVILGDICPMPEGLGLLGNFFSSLLGTRLDLHFESIAGPWERLFEDAADLILHWIDKADPRLEWIDLGVVAFIPVVAPGFLPFPPNDRISPAQMRALPQCIIRDTARNGSGPSFHVLEGAPQCTVADHRMKKEVVTRGLAWGHLPQFLIEEELADGRLLSIAGEHFPGVRSELVAARRRDHPHGPVAERLWRYLADQAGRPAFSSLWN